MVIKLSTYYPLLRKNVDYFCFVIVMVYSNFILLPEPILVISILVLNFVFFKSKIFKLFEKISLQ